VSAAVKLQHERQAPEIASAHCRNAMQILAQPDDAIGPVELAAIRARLTKALEQIEATDATLETTGIHIEIDWERDRFRVARRFRRVELETRVYAHAINVARDLRHQLGGAPDITLCTKRAAIAPRGD
jgi:hypothetical protein